MVEAKDKQAESRPRLHYALQSGDDIHVPKGGDFYEGLKIATQMPIFSIVLPCYFSVKSN